MTLTPGSTTITPYQRPKISLIDSVAAFSKHHGLSQRQSDVMYFFIEGMSYEEIGDRLGITYTTTRYYAEGIFKKTGFKNKHKVLSAFIKYLAGENVK